MEMQNLVQILDWKDNNLGNTKNDGTHRTFSTRVCFHQDVILREMLKSIYSQKKRFKHFPFLCLLLFSDLRGVPRCLVQ